MSVVFCTCFIFVKSSFIESRLGFEQKRRTSPDYKVFAAYISLTSDRVYIFFLCIHKRSVVSSVAHNFRLSSLSSVQKNVSTKKKEDVMLNSK